MNKHQYPHGLIGNCGYLALINKNTNVDWMCLPRFDSSFVFGKLLDDRDQGEFSIKPAEGDFESNQYYERNSNVLVTEISQGDDAYRVTDFAPRFYQIGRTFRPLMFIRKVEPLKGIPRIRVKCTPVGDYGETVLRQERGSNHIRYQGLDETLRLSTNIPLNYISESRDFVLNQTYYMVMTYGVPLEGEIRETVDTFLTKTIRYWQSWVKSTSVGPLFQKEVIRSSLVLKICQYEDTGAIIASPTTSLPESPGSTRNWDYRYCWMRDSYYTITTFNNIGHFEEMEKYFMYLTNIPMKENERIQPLYSILGNDKLIENEMPISGYQGNVPVRVGNDAYTHIQNDVYGQILLAILPLYLDERFKTDIGELSDQLLENIIAKMELTIDEPDAGIWEFRTIANHHTYTNLFQWAGAMAAYKVARLHKNKSLENRAKIIMEKAAAWIEKAYIPELNAYAQGVGNKAMDASTLQLIMMNYIPHNSQKARDQLTALEADLKAGKGLFYRYKNADDFGKPETTFLICGFWYVEALACVGRIDSAIEAFEELVSYSNHLGLLSEDVDSTTGSQWGNFPQAYSHLGLINAAYRINNKLYAPNFLGLKVD